MAFYGRITNESKTSMTFDRVYPNRVTMDAYAESDGVFSGRFVLVEYDTPVDVEKPFDITSGDTYIANVNNVTNIYKLLLNDNNKVYGYVAVTQDELNAYEYGTGFVAHLYTSLPAPDESELIIATFTEEELETIKDLPGCVMETITEPDPEDPAGEPISIEKPKATQAFVINEEYAELNDLIWNKWAALNIPAKQKAHLLVIKKEADISTLIDVSSSMVNDETGETDEFKDAYSINYNIDKEKYPRLGRGYDSTVWRKVTNADGVSYYVMLAELNSVVPNFDITPVKPVDLDIDDPEELKPKFGKDSSNVYYDLQMPSTWGIKINGLGWDGQTASLDPWDPEYSVTTSTGPNEITVTKVKSGNTYQGVEEYDIQQVDFHLPGLGAMADEMWDKIYGEGSDEDGKRNTNIKWYHGHEVATLSDEIRSNDYEPLKGLITKDGKYTPDDANEQLSHLSNIADTIRSTYDIMGMIIEPITIEDFLHPGTKRPTSKTAPGYIYYVNATDEEIDESEDLTNEQKALIKENRFFVLDKKSIFGEDITTQTQLGNGKIYIPIPDGLVQPFVQDTYLVTNVNDPDDFTLNTLSEAVPDYSYYRLNTESFSSVFTKIDDATAVQHNFDRARDSGCLFTKSLVEGNILLNQVPTTVSQPVEGTKYYFIPQNGISEINNNENTRGVPFFLDKNSTKQMFFDENNNPLGDEEFRQLDPGAIIYIKSRAERVVDEDGTIRYETELIKVAEKGTFDKNNIQIGKLYEWQKSSLDWGESIDLPDMERMSSCYWVKTFIGDNLVYQLLSKRPAGKSGILDANFPDSVKGTDNVNLSEDKYNTVKLVQINNISLLADFYKPNTIYWGIDENENYDIAHVYFKKSENNDNIANTYKSEYNKADTLSAIMLDEGIYGVNGNTDYSATTATALYFVPNELYIKTDSDYYELQSTYPTSTVTFYTLQSAVVKEDNTGGQFRIGEVWNSNLNLDEINLDPNNPEVVLGYRTSEWAFFPLDAYAKDLNTINGIIVAMRKLIGNDENSRDTSTLQGMLNTLEDKLNKLDDTPGDTLVVTDKYGHLDGVVKVGPEIVDPETGEGTNVFEPSTKTPEEGYDAFITQTMSGATMEDGTVIPDIVADNNTDGLDNNSWITADIKTNSDGQAFGYILHNTVTVDTSTASSTNLNDGTDTITLEDIEYDGAGHIVGKHPHEYTLPYGFKTVNINGDEIVAQNTQDTLNFISDYWIYMDHREPILREFTTVSGTIQKNSNPVLYASPSGINILPKANADIIFDWECTTQDADLSNLILILEFLIEDVWTEYNWAGGNTTQIDGHYWNTLPSLTGIKEISIASIPEAARRARIGIYNNSIDDVSVTLGGQLDMHGEDCVLVNHSIPKYVAHNSTASLTPKFGESFEIIDYDFDIKGHKANDGSHTITIPAITFSDASTSTDGYTAITGLSFDSTTGAIVIERDPIDNALLHDYVTTTSESENPNAPITTSTPIAEAISLLEYRIATGLNALTATLTFTSTDNILSLGLKQTNGLINDLTGGIDLISLATTTIGAAGEGGEPDTYVLTTTHKDIAGAINELKDRIDGIAATTFTPEGYVKILRTTSTAPVSSTSANIAALQNASTNSEYCASYSGLNTIATGWLWWIANTGSIYFCTSTGTDGSTTSWELLNSWR